MSKVNREDLVISKIVLEPLKDEMRFIQVSLNTVAERYSFLQSHDIERTKKMLIEAFLLDTIMESNSEEVIFNEELFFKTISKETKERIYEATFDKFLSKITIQDLLKEK